MPTLIRLRTYFVILGGPIVTLLAIAWSHIQNLLIRPEVYLEAPPSISRVIVDPQIGEPFAIAILIASALVSSAVILIILTVKTESGGVATKSLSVRIAFWALVFFETIAIIGMLVLSQYRTPEWQSAHNLGSYMLFFGHGIGLPISGFIIARLLGAKTKYGGKFDHLLFHLRGQPRFSFWLGVASFCYGCIYFIGRELPDQYFFWQRLVQCIFEVFLLAVFLVYLGRFAPFVAATYARRHQMPSIASQQANT